MAPSSSSTLDNEPAMQVDQSPVVRFVAGDARRASISALAVSLLLHAMFWLIAAFLVMGGGGGGGAGSGGDPGPVEMAVVTEGELRQLEAQALGMATPAVPDAVVRDAELVTNIPDAGPSSSFGGSDDLGDLGSLSGGGDITMGGDGSGLGGSGGSGASFFGVEAQGNRFAYLVDVSGSMQEALPDGREGTRIAALKAELARSTSGLLENSQFVVISFSSDSSSISGKTEWLEASPSGKKRIVPFIQQLNPAGGTNPKPGFEMIFNLKPRPDAIYFMTDGEFDESMVMEVAELNFRTKIPIHCICLGSDAGADNMRAIAKASRGTFHIIGGQPRKP